MNATRKLDTAARSARSITAPSKGRRVLALSLFLATALALSSFRIVPAPGIALTLAPFFYLLAFRFGGIRLSLPTALLVTAPTLFWWGHPVIVLISAAHVLFLRYAPTTRGLTLPTTLFYALPGAAIIALFLWLQYDPPLATIVLTIIKKVLNDVAAAATVDLLTTLFVFRPAALRLEKRSSVSLSQLVSSTVTLLVIIIVLVVLVEHARPMSAGIAAHRQAIERAVEVAVLRLPPAQRPSRAELRIDIHAARSERVVIGYSRAAVLSPAVLTSLGCSRLDAGEDGINDRTTVAYWISACATGTIPTNSGPVYYAYATRELATDAYRELLRHLIAPALLFLLALAVRLALLRAVEHALARWTRLLQDFGTPELTRPEGWSFTEFDVPVEAFVDANNRHAQLMQDRERLAGAVMELQRGIGLRLLAGIRFDAGTGRLHFVEVGVDRPGQPESAEVHRNDRLALDNARGRDEALVELRFVDAGREQWFLLLARELEPDGSWRSGCLVRMQQPNVVADRTLHQARLMELGGMASALSHELKQPLFTIALSAEAGSLILGRDGVETPASEKFHRILRQVERAREIIGRISHYARVDADENRAFELRECVKGVTNFMRPLTVRENIRVEIAAQDGPPLRVLLPRVALEQVLVNLIQNAVDAIAARAAGAAPGHIRIGIAQGATGPELSVEDNGIGLEAGAPETLFNAFVTTKPAEQGTGLGLYICRQIMLELGGRITLGPAGAAGTGARIVLTLPASVLLEEETAAAH